MLTYEEGLNRLLEIEKALEKPDTPIDTVLSLYQEGQRLISELEKKLQDARLSVEEWEAGDV